MSMSAQVEGSGTPPIALAVTVTVLVDPLAVGSELIEAAVGWAPVNLT